MAGAEVGTLADLVRDADLSTRIPWSRTWRLGDLVHHVGGVHRWAAALVREEARGYRPIRDTDDWPSDPTSARAARWLLAGRDGLVDVLRERDPDERVWAWGPHHHVRFWSRRMTHETAVHRADAELALGRDPSFSPQLAGDGVNEFLENLWSARAWRRDMGALRGDGESLRFDSTDTGERWRIERNEKGFDWSYHPRPRAPRGDVTVAAPVADLYLLVWKRLRPEAPTVTLRGDRSVFDHWARYSSV
jgi:uncharacterized protein (TIGR03083 family)